MNTMKTLARWATAPLLLAALTFSVTPAQAGGPIPAKRVALVIGNAKYGDDLVSGVRDAEAMIDRLLGLGFSSGNIYRAFDGDLDEWTSKIEAFSSNLQGASLVVVFYSGHGFSVDGQNYLLPKHGQPKTGRALLLKDLIVKLAKAPDRTPKLVFINACRNTPPSSGLVGMTEPATVPPKGVVLSFAAGPGQFAESGRSQPETLAPFVLATLRYLGQPGLRLVDMLGGIHDEVAAFRRRQEPRASGFESMKDFLVRDAATVDVVADSFDDDMSVVLNGDVILDGSAGQPSRRTATLRAGRNDLTVLVSNFPSFQDHQSWQVTEGWSYRLRLFTGSGVELKLPHGQFAACEHHPFKGGPHHGGIFPVAKAEIYVDPQTATVELRNPQTDLHEKSLPSFARNQGLLYSKSLEDLGFRSHPTLGKHLATLDSVRAFLTLLKVGSIPIPDTRQIFAEVRGNLQFQEAVATCMDDPGRRQDRQGDAVRSIDTLLNDRADKRPFQSFDLGLSNCVRERVNPELRAELGSRELLIWTDFSTTQATPGPETCEMTPL